MEFKQQLLEILQSCENNQSFIFQMENIFTSTINYRPEHFSYDKGAFFYQSGDVLYNENKIEYALLCFQKAVELLLTVNEVEFSINSYLIIGGIYKELKLFKLSVENFYYGISLCGDENEFWEKKYTLYLQIADLVKSKDIYEKALFLAKTHNDTRKIADCYIAIGNIYKNNDQRTPALKSYLAIIDLYQANPNKNFNLLGRAFLGISNIYESYNVLSKGMECTYQALEYFRIEENGKAWDFASCYSNLGNLYLDLVFSRMPTEYPEKLTNEVYRYFMITLKYFSLALDHSRTIESTYLEDDIIVKLSDLVRWFSDDDNLKAFFKRFFSDIWNKNLGTYSLSDFLQEILLQISERHKVNSPFLAISALRVLVKIHLYKSSIPNTTSAELCIKRALQICPNSSFENKLYIEYGIISFYKKKFEDAYKYLKKSFQYIQNHENIMANDDLKVSTYGLHEDHYHYLIQVCLALGKNTEALYYLEFSKSKAFRELLLTSNLHHPPNANATFKAKEEALIKSLKSMIFSFTPDFEGGKYLELSALYDKNKEYFPKYISLRQSQIPSFLDIKSAL